MRNKRNGYQNMLLTCDFNRIPTHIKAIVLKGIFESEGFNLSCIRHPKHDDNGMHTLTFIPDDTTKSHDLLGHLSLLVKPEIEIKMNQKVSSVDNVLD